MTQSKFKLQEVHNFLNQNSKEIFAEKIAENNYYEFIQDTINKSSQELLNMINDPDFEESLQTYGMDEFSPISEYLYFFSENDSILKDDYDLQTIVNNEKPIWQIKPEKVAFLLKKMKISFDDIQRRIKNEYIFGGSLGSVMARADKNSDGGDLYNASVDFAIKKEEHKRDVFLNKLKDHY
jgi:hypothetical protein